jgi:hypothetical protein
MSYSYTPRKIMRDVDYGKTENKLFVKKLLEHDYRMISHVSNFDFELVKKYIDGSITFLELADMRKVASHDDIEKIIRYAYNKTRSFKKQFLHFLRHINKTLLGDSEQYIEYYRQDSHILDFDISRVSDILADMFLYDPTILFAFNENYLNKLFTSVNIDLSMLIKKISFKKTEKAIMKLINKYEHGNAKWSRNKEKDNFFTFLGEERLASTWWGDSELFVKDTEKKINQLQDLFKDRPEFLSLILLIRLK